MEQRPEETETSPPDRGPIDDPATEAQRRAAEARPTGEDESPNEARPRSNEKSAT
jgi:hypothetical protein